MTGVKGLLSILTVVLTVLVDIGKASFVHDPDQLMTETQENMINDIVKSLRDTKSCLCHHPENCGKTPDHVIFVEVHKSSLTGQVNGTFKVDDKPCRMELYLLYDDSSKTIKYEMNRYAMKILGKLHRITEIAGTDYFSKGRLFEGLIYVLEYCQYTLHAGIVANPFSIWDDFGKPLLISIPVIIISSIIVIWCYETCKNE